MILIFVFPITVDIVGDQFSKKGKEGEEISQ